MKPWTSASTSYIRKAARFSSTPPAKCSRVCRDLLERNQLTIGDVGIIMIPRQAT